MSWPVTAITAGLRLRAQPNIEQRIRFVEGRAPEATDDEVTEIAVSAETLASLRSGGWILGRPLAVGDQVTLNPERGDSLPVRIVGIFEPLEPTQRRMGRWRRSWPPASSSRATATSVAVHGDGAHRDRPGARGVAEPIRRRIRLRLALHPRLGRVGSGGGERSRPSLRALRVKLPVPRLDRGPDGAQRLDGPARPSSSATSPSGGTPRRP